MRLLSNDGPPDWHPAPAALCRARGTDLGRLALQYSMADPEIHTHIVDTASSKRVLENIADAEAPLDQELLTEVLQILRPVHNLTSPSGRPENN